MDAHAVACADLFFNVVVWLWLEALVVVTVNNKIDYCLGGGSMLVAKRMSGLLKVAVDLLIHELVKRMPQLLELSRMLIGDLCECLGDQFGLGLLVLAVKLQSAQFVPLALDQQLKVAVDLVLAALVYKVDPLKQVLVVDLKFPYCPIEVKGLPNVFKCETHVVDLNFIKDLGCIKLVSFGGIT